MESRVEIAVAGDTLTAHNRNRFSSNVSSIVVTSSPTLGTDDGTQLATAVIPGGTGGNATGGISGSFEEWILKTNESYLFRLTNISGNTKAVMLQLDWYEPGLLS